MILKLDWRIVSQEAIGNNLPIPIWECMVGKYKNGVTWLCRVKYRIWTRDFMVLFDTDIVTNEDCPFLRHDVVYANNYWSAMREYYKVAFVKYEEIQNVIARVIDENKLT